MKKAITIGLAAVALGVPLTYVIAASRYNAPAPAAEAMPAYDLLNRLRALELEPQGEPVRRGPYYVLHAIDARGRTLRVVADAELGDILSIAPVRGPAWHQQGGPRIIHVPDPNEVQDARTEEEWPADTPADIEDPEDLRPAAPRPRQVRPVQRKADLPPPKHEPAPRRSLSSAPAPGPKPAEPPVSERRNMISAPPAEARAPVDSDGLSPVYPTPRFTPPDDKTMPPPAEPAKTDVPAEAPSVEPQGAAAPVQQ
jgi:hypothetical protein